MKPSKRIRFSLRTILLCVAFVAICLAIVTKNYSYELRLNTTSSYSAKTLVVGDRINFLRKHGRYATLICGKKTIESIRDKSNDRYFRVTVTCWERACLFWAKSRKELGWAHS